MALSMSPSLALHRRALAWPAIALLVACTPAGAPPSDADDGRLSTDAPQPPPEVGVRAADDFDANVAGVITSATLRRWLDGWETQRPDAVAGELVVLQLDAADDALPWLASRDGVRAYHAAELDRLMEERNNGVLASGTVPARGVRVDMYLRRHRIDPERDLILLATGRSSPAGLVRLARAWLSLRYWGVGHQHLALLEGDLADATRSADRTGTATLPPIDGAVRVTMLPAHPFGLHAALGDVIEALDAGTRPWDLRAAATFDDPAPDAVPADDTCLLRRPVCTTTFGTRLAGARQVPLSLFFDEDAQRFLRPAVIDARLAEAGLADERAPLLYDADGTRSALAAFALLAVAGRDVRWYAAGLAEWGALNATHPDPSLRVLPEDSPWRTDRPGRSEAIGRWAAAETAVRPLAIGPRAPRADRVRTDDFEYLRTAPALPAPSAGTNACD